MTNLEITKLCAEAMGITVNSITVSSHYLATDPITCETYQAHLTYQTPYFPLYDDAQAMALFKRFPIECLKALDTEIWGARGPDEEWAESPNLNRAICECVAKIKAGEK